MMTVEEVGRALRTGRISIGYRKAITHYQGAWITSLVAVFALLFSVTETGLWRMLIIGGGLLLFVAAVVQLVMRYRELGFIEVNTVFSQAKLEEIINEVVAGRGWIRGRRSKRYFLARTTRRNDEGELITILYDDARILINSIHNLKKEPPFFPNLKNRRNIDAIAGVVRNRQAGH